MRRSTAGIKIFSALFLLLGGYDVKAAEPKIIYEEDPTLLTTTVQVLVLSGASSDPVGKAGLSNMLSDLVFRGTKKRSRTKFQSEIEKMGAGIGGRVSHDSLIFGGRVIKENTMPFMKLLAEALLQPAFLAAELSALKTENLAEIANVKNNNARLSGLAIRRTMFSGTVLEVPLQGNLTSVKSVTLADIKLAYNDRFHRGNLVFAISSPLKEAEMKKACADIWNGMPDGMRRTNASVPMKQPTEPTLVVVHKPKTSTGAVTLGQAGIIASDPMRYPLMTGNYSFGGEPLVSRLFRVIRSDLGWTYQIGSTYGGMGPLTNQQGFYMISSTPAVEFTGKTILKLLSMWKDYNTDGLKDSEIRLAKDSLINSYPFDFESADKRLWQRLYSYLYNVPVLSQEEFSDTIGGIDNKKVMAALKARQSIEGWVVAVVADKGVVEKQLAEEQKELPAAKRLKISRVLTPDEIVQ